MLTPPIGPGRVGSPSARGASARTPPQAEPHLPDRVVDTAGRAAPGGAPAESEPVTPLDERLTAAVERTVAEALARVSTEGDAQVAAQKSAFDRFLAAQAEQLRESNAIREMMAKQREREDEFLKEWIRSI